MFKLPIKDYLLVVLQALLFLCYLPEPSWVNLELPNALHVFGLFCAVFGVIIGLVAMLQLNTNLSPFPTPKSNSALIQDGIFKYVRHPIYTGILIGAFGYAIFSESVYKMGITLLLFVLFYYKSIYEEKQLRNTFNQYDDYMTSTGRFFPKWYTKSNR